MSDHALALKPAAPLSAEQLASRLRSLRTCFGDGLRSTLGEPPAWRVIDGLIVVFENWDERAASLVETPGGGVAAAEWKDVVVEGELRHLPEIPADNPPAELLLERLFDQDRRLVAAHLDAPDSPSAAAGLEPRVVHR